MDILLRATGQRAASNAASTATLALRMLAWFLVRPSVWQAYVRAADPALGPSFCLAELRADQWRNPAIARAVVAACVVMPVATAFIVALALATFGRFQPFIGVGLGLGVAIGLLFSAIVSVPAGAAVSVVAVAALGIAWSRPDVLLIDFMLSARLGWVYGLVSLAAVYVTGNMARRSVSYSSPRQVGSVVIGLLVGGGVVALIVFLLTTFIGDRQTTSNTRLNTGVIFALVPAIGLAFAAMLRTSKLDRSVLVGAIAFGLILFLYGNAGYEFGNEPPAPQLLVSFIAPVTAAFLVLFTLPFAFVERIAGVWAGAIAGALGGLGVHWGFWRIFNVYALEENALIAGVLILLGFTMTWWRPILFYPFEAALGTILLQAEMRRERGGSPTATTTHAQVLKRSGRYLRWHPAFWDEGQWLPIYGLDQHLLTLSERDPDEARRMIAAVSATNQRWAARAAQVELDARRLESCETVSDIAGLGDVQTSADVLGDASHVFLSLSKVSNDARAGLNQSSNYNQRLVLRAASADLTNLLNTLTRSKSTYARRFGPIVQRWQSIVAEHLEGLERSAAARQEIPDPYIVGVPLTRHQEIFVGRTDITQRIEAILRNDDQPPLLLYGQRRMGKTSLLFNLRWMLPNRITPLVVDLQGPVSQSKDHASFLYNLAKGMTTSAGQQDLALPKLSREDLADDAFTRFDDWLDVVETTLVGRNRSTILLALDEFEALDQALNNGNGDGSGGLREEAVLGTLRHIVQYRPRFKLILAGSHTLNEFRRWSSYLINAQTLHLSFLKESETRQLITQPVRDFPLHYDVAALDRVLFVTRGHPYLVQLLCSEVVNLKNEQDADIRLCATRADVETALPLMIERGRQFFADIEVNQVSRDGLAVLRTLAAQGERRGCSQSELARQFDASLNVGATLKALMNRELVKKSGEEYCFQVEAIRLWFAH